MKKLRILIPTLMAASLTPLVTMVGCKDKDPDPEPEVKSFAEDSWTNVCSYASQGIKKMHDVYSEDCKNNKDFPNTLIGLKRKIKLNGVDHEVIVLDENHDTYAEGGTTHFAALTFQFNNLFSNKSGGRITTSWDTANTHNYWNSTMYQFLNNDTDDELMSVYEIIKNENSELIGNIKQVKQTVNVYNDSSWAPVKNNEFLFLPSLAHLWSKAGIEAETSVVKAQKDNFCAEGSQYKYFSKEIGDDPVSYDNSYNCLSRRSVGGESYWYWLTSPAYESTKWETMSCVIHQASRFDHENVYVTPGDCIAPCFCI